MNLLYRTWINYDNNIKMIDRYRNKFLERIHINEFGFQHKSKYDSLMNPNESITYIQSIINQSNNIKIFDES